MSTIKSSAENLTLNADGSGNDISMQSNAAEKLKLTAEGNLHLQGSDSRIQLNAQGGANVVGNNTVHIRGDGAHLKLMTASGGNYLFEVNGTEELRVQSGGGISFNGDTAAANALDDYEEGTWTPTITAASGGSVSYTTQLASYTKVGNLVSVTCQLDFTKNTSSGNYAVAGQPFNFTTNICKGQGYDWYNPSGTALMNTHIHVDPNGSTFRLYCNTGTSVDATALPFSSSLVSSRCVIRFSLTYQTA